MGKISPNGSRFDAGPFPATRQPIKPHGKRLQSQIRPRRFVFHPILSMIDLMKQRSKLTMSKPESIFQKSVRRRLTARMWILLAFLIGMAAPCSLLHAAEPVKIGVLAFRPKPQTLAQWQPLASALKRAMPERDFVVEAFTYPELENAVAKHQLDFVLTNASHYVLLSQRGGLSAPLATLQQDEHGQAISTFGGVIFCRADIPGLDSLHDLKGKTIAIANTKSLGGYQAQAYELSKAGVRLPKDAKLRVTGMPHDNVLKEVLSGQAEAGFVRSGVLESMVREGKLDMARIKILNLQNRPDFPAQISTRLYPEWPFAARLNIDENLARHVAAALFLLEENTAATKAMGIHGFAIPANYVPVADMLRELRMSPFEMAPEFTLHDVWTQYLWQIIAAVAASILFLLMALRLTWTKRKLDQKHAQVLQQQQQLQELAFHDMLTLLPNRRLLYDRLSQSMAASKRSGRYCALMYLDLDNFKPVNDIHGHEAGDLLLIEVARRLKSCVRETDTASRLGGDEFVLILSELDTDRAESVSQAHAIAEKIRTALSHPYLLTIRHEGKTDAGIEHRCTASIGMVLFINHQASQDAIMKLADKALYQAKASGRNRVCFNDTNA